jgi:hypothetical protein
VCTAAALQRYELALAKLQQQRSSSGRGDGGGGSSGSYGVCILPLFKIATAPPFDSPQQSTRRAPSAFGRYAFSEATR